MDEMTSYYPPPPSSSYSDHSHSYYPPPPQQPFVAVPPPPSQSSYSHYSLSQPYSHHPHHQQPQHYLPPHYTSYAQPPPSQSIEDLKTLFIAGLPEDVKPREIYNLFREFPGYQSSQLRSANEKVKKPYGFAVFKDQPSAVAALQALNGLVFDLETKSTLHINLAKSNSRSKRLKTDDERYSSSDKRVKGSDVFSTGLSETGVGSNSYLSGMGNSAYNTTAYLPIQSHGIDTGALNAAETKKMSTSAPYVPRNNNPCPTLFVANLGQTCTEQELNQVFSRCPGFLKLKMQNKNGAPVAFVDFQDLVNQLELHDWGIGILTSLRVTLLGLGSQQDITSSAAALHNLQDCVLHSSMGEGMRLEYAKSRMGLRKKSS